MTRKEEITYIKALIDSDSLHIIYFPKTIKLLIEALEKIARMEPYQHSSTCCEMHRIANEVLGELEKPVDPYCECGRPLSKHSGCTNAYCPKSQFYIAG